MSFTKTAGRWGFYSLIGLASLKPVYQSGWEDCLRAHAVRQGVEETTYVIPVVHRDGKIKVLDFKNGTILDVVIPKSALEKAVEKSEEFHELLGN